MGVKKNIVSVTESAGCDHLSKNDISACVKERERERERDTRMGGEE